jgi:hypothetical protein
MNFAAAVLACRCLVRDTFRQALSSGIFWLMLGVTALCAVLCLGVRLDDGELSLWFGSVALPPGHDREQAACWLEMQLAGWIVDGAGLLLALVWTAGFLPSFLEAGSVSVLLAKPLPRWWLLAGKAVGVHVFVALQAALFVGATWVALGLATGAWPAAYLLAAPMLLVQFTIFFSFSALLAVATRSAVACVFGSIAFWLVCWGMNYGRHVFLSVPELQALGSGLGWLVEAGYWVLPKPADLGILFFDGLHAGSAFSKALGIKAVQEQGGFHPLLSVLSSLLFAAAVLVVSAHDFVEADY